MNRLIKLVVKNTSQERKSETSCVAIGINGLDCSEKTYLAGKFYDYALKNDYKVGLIHVDDYCDSKVIKDVYTKFKNSFLSSADVNYYYEECIDTKKLLEAINRAKDESEILIIEGIFIFKSFLREMFDFKIYLDVDEEQAFNRFIARKKFSGYETIFKDVWLAAHKIYCREVNPKTYADLLITNDFLQPKIQAYNNKMQWITKNITSLQNLQALV